MENEIEKTYYSMGETAAMFDVNQSLLRYWEKEFDIIKPYKNKKGDRFFTKKDIETIRTIYFLTKIKGYTLQGAKDAMKHGYVEEATKAQMVENLNRIKQFLLDIKEEL